MSSEFYKAGVLIIGSLLWDNSKGRKAWREHYFGENYYPNIIDVKIPIRYGRYSAGRECPTMVFSHDFLKNNKYGLAKFLPFKNNSKSINDLITSARDLSEAEGSTSRKFLKGGNTKWCIITCLLNNQLSKKKAEIFLESWVDNYNQELTSELIDNFKMDSEEQALIDNQGFLKMEWPESLSSFDLVLTTQTKPRRNEENDSSNYLNTAELASQIFKKPEYFVKNKLSGISTTDDSEIIGELKNNTLSDFKKNAKYNGCLEIEIDRFTQNFMQ
jgi:hypothetical protein